MLNYLHHHKQPMNIVLNWNLISWLPPVPVFKFVKTPQMAKISYNTQNYFTLMLWLYTWQQQLLKRNNRVLKIATIFWSPQTSRFTLVKAPIAHKAFSKEQYEIKHYPLSIKLSFPPSQCENHYESTLVNVNPSTPLFVTTSFTNKTTRLVITKLY